jgi:outer membrane protein, multidrug efflux system
MRKHALNTLAASLFLSGCAAFTPDYQAPSPALPTAFAGADRALPTHVAQDAAWWRHFGDPALEELVREALETNRELRASLARVEAARARLGLAAQDYLPTGNAAASRVRTQRAEVEGGGKTTFASAGFDTSWEIDLFGKAASAVRGARARLGSREASADDLRLTIAAEVMRVYFEWRGAQRRIALLEAFVSDQQMVVDLNAIRAESGDAAPEDLSRARAQLAGDRAALAAEQAREREQVHALAVLLGRTPGQWAAPAVAPLPVLELRAVAVGNPAQLIRRRPDVRRAERQLAAAIADTGVATADLFPQVRISGFLGYAAGSLSDLGEHASGSWSFAPTISWPIFDLGRVRANIRAREHEASAALADYEQVVLRALADAENAFSGYGRAQQRLAALSEQVRHARQTAAVARARYEEGETDYRASLDADRDARQAEAALVDGLVQQRLATVAIHKALGVVPAVGRNG